MASIKKRVSKSGEVSFRVQVRLKGHPTAYATFKRKTDAGKWAQSTEAAMRERRYFKTSIAQKHNVAEMIDRYIEKLKRERPKRYKDTATTLEWWKQNLYVSLWSGSSSRAFMIILLNSLTHTKGWEAVWNSLLNQPINCPQL